jgi:hypothetical protein
LAGPVSSADEADGLAAAWNASGARAITTPALQAVFDILAPGLDEPWTDATLRMSAQAVIRAWARWLKNMGTTSTPYLLHQFIRRPGRIQVQGDAWLVELEPRPLDVVLQLSGYLDPIEFLVPQPLRSVRFRIGPEGMS